LLPYKAFIKEDAAMTGLVMATWTLGYLARALWMSATLTAWMLSLRAIVGAGAETRPLVQALRWGTFAGIAELVGLFLMVSVDNVSRYRTAAWIVSLAPLGLVVLAIIRAARRDRVLASAALD
jgi:hypothetical protein